MLIPVMSAHLDEGVSCPIVRDGEAKGVFCLRDLHLFGLPPDVGEDEVLQANLTPQQLLHVHLMGVQRAEEDLEERNTRKRAE